MILTVFDPLPLTVCINCSFVWPPCVADAVIIFNSYGFFFIFPRLFSAVGNWTSIILPRMAWP